MSAEVRLTIVQGLQEGKEFVFRQRVIGAIGRGEGCLLRLPGDLAHLDVSRRHCLLDINPPTVRVRDLGSRNGTYVNGMKIGQREHGLRAEAALACEMPERVLEDGDELRVGGTVFRVSICGDRNVAGKPRRCGEGSAVLVG